ncbi:hypothetical protein BD779DRAFT_378546 [Infundibulicybe gibba]|nr:hypothetical protein BD779DRAFT_378546 [Infundibulicybe gibba]
MDLERAHSYLSRTAVMTRSGWDDRLSDLQEGFNINDSPDEATAMASNDIVSSHQSIVYSQTYQVPVFYFTIQDPTGSPLPLSDIVRTSLFRPSVLDGLEATTFALTPPLHHSRCFPRAITQPWERLVGTFIHVRWPNRSRS